MLISRESRFTWFASEMYHMNFTWICLKKLVFSWFQLYLKIEMFFDLLNFKIYLNFTWNKNHVIFMRNSCNFHTSFMWNSHQLIYLWVSCINSFEVKLSWILYEIHINLNTREIIVIKFACVYQWNINLVILIYKINIIIAESKQDPCQRKTIWNIRDQLFYSSKRIRFR